MSPQYPSSAPPTYSDSAAEPLLVENEAFTDPAPNKNSATPSSSGNAPPPFSAEASNTPRSAGDHIPDDFKFGGFVSDCEASVRQAFVRKVYTILSCQILTTVGIASTFIFFPSLSQWALHNIWSFYVSLVLAFATMLTAFVKAKSYPTNMIFLSLFTLCEAYLIGFVTAMFDTKIVIQALAITVAVFVGLTIVAMTSKYDFTSWVGVVSTAFFFLFGASMVQLFIPFSSTLNLVYSCIGALIFSVYILIDTQMVMEHFYPEDEVIAAITLYLDIINLFLYILRILQASNDN